MTNVIGPALVVGHVDPRQPSLGDNRHTRIVGPAIFTCNATGTTTTAVGANANPATPTNVVRIGEKFKLFTAAGVLKEEKVFEITAVAVAGSTTITYSPASAVAPVSGDVLKKVGIENLQDIDDLEDRLTAAGYTARQLLDMTPNDKQYAVRFLDDPAGI